MARKCEGVHAGIEVADHRSHVEEARDGLVVCVERLQVDVGARAAQDDEKHRLVGAAVEGPVGDADELLGRLVEVGVLPCGAQLVVMVHRVHGRLGETELGDKLLDGVRLDDAVAVRVVVPGRDELRLVGEVLAVDVVGLAPRSAFGRAVGAPDAVAGVFGQVHDGRARHAAQHVLVHEALSVLVHHEYSFECIAAPVVGASSFTDGAQGADGVLQAIAERCASVGQRFGLSGRERDVLSELVRGRTIATIAGELGVSENTAKAHTKAIYRKLDVHTREELLARVEQG